MNLFNSTPIWTSKAQKLFHVFLNFITSIITFLRERPDLSRKLIVMLAPYLLILTSGWDWIFANDSIDPFNYSAIFLNYFGDSEFFPGAYKFGRLPWIFLGYFFFSIFSPKIAIVLLGSSFFSLTLLGVYIFMRNVLGSNIAFILSLALGFSTPFQISHSGGVFYHNLSSAAFLIWSFALLSQIYQNNQKNKKYIFCSGIFAALALHCNITIINFLPLFIGLFYLIDEKKHLKLIVERLSLFLAGGLIITFVFMALNWIVRGDPFFFANIFKVAKLAIKDPTNFQKPWWESWGSLWFLNKNKLHVLVLTGIYFGTLAIIPFKSKWGYALQSKNGKRALYCIGQYIFLFTVWLFWQTAGQTALNFDYFSYPLIIPAFTCLGGLLFLATKGSFSLSPKLYYVLPLLFLAIAISGIGSRVNSDWILYLYVFASLLVFLLFFFKKNLSIVILIMVFSLACEFGYGRVKEFIGTDYTLSVVKAQQYISNTASWSNINTFFSGRETILDQDSNVLGYHPSSILTAWRPILKNVWEKDLFASENIWSEEVTSLINGGKTLIVISEDEGNDVKLRKLFSDYNAELVETGNYPIKLKNGGSFRIRSFKTLKKQIN